MAKDISEGLADNLILHEENRLLTPSCIAKGTSRPPLFGFEELGRFIVDFEGETLFDFFCGVVFSSLLNSLPLDSDLVLLSAIILACLEGEPFKMSERLPLLLFSNF